MRQETRAPRAVVLAPRAGHSRGHLVSGGCPMIKATAILAAVAACAASVALAHHGWSEYDANSPLTLTGAIKESGYEHPHGHIRLAAPGKVWLVVLAPPSRMENRGLSKEALRVGSEVTVTGYPNRNKPEEMRAERITADGKTVELR
jgi:hypothetical protein